MKKSVRSLCLLVLSAVGYTYPFRSLHKTDDIEEEILAKYVYPGQSFHVCEVFSDGVKQRSVSITCNCLKVSKNWTSTVV